MGEKKLTELLIDDMKVDDLSEILSIERASFEIPWSEILFHNEIFKAIAVSRVARINGKVAGYLCANIIIDEGHILNLAVHPEHRGAGIASRLLQHMIAEMRDRGCRSIFLEVRISNRNALKMYEKLGFTLLGTRKAYYASPVEDAVVMVLRLTGERG
jgi:ribosomal-protein-alanine N-acetyltransferase